MSLTLADRELINRLVNFLIGKVCADELSIPSAVSHIANVAAALGDKNSDTWRLYIAALVQNSATLPKVIRGPLVKPEH